MTNPGAEEPPPRCFPRGLGIQIRGALVSTSHALPLSPSVNVRAVAEPGHSGSYRLYLEGALRIPWNATRTSLVIKTQPPKHKNSNRRFLRNSPHLHLREPGLRTPASAGLGSSRRPRPHRCYYYKPISGSLGGKGSTSQFVRDNNNFPVFAHCFSICSAWY